MASFVQSVVSLKARELYVRFATANSVASTSLMRSYGQTGSRSTFSTLCVAAVGCVEYAKMLVLSEDGVMTWLRAVFVRGNSGSLAMSACRAPISESVEPTTCAADDHRREQRPHRGDVGDRFATFHCVSCAFVGLICRLPSLPVVA